MVTREFGAFEIDANFTDSTGNLLETSAGDTITISLDNVEFLSITGTASLDLDSETLTLDGDVSTSIAGESIELFSGEHSFSAGDEINSDLSNIAQKFQISGLDVSLTNISLATSGVQLQGSITLPSELGGEEISIEDSNDILISSSGISLTGGEITLPGKNTFKLGDLTVETDDISLDISTSPETFIFQGEASVKDLVPGTDISVTADFKSPGHIEITPDSDPILGIDGSVSLADVTIIENVLEIEEFDLSIDTTADTLSADAKIKAPDGITLDGKIGFVKGELDSIGFSLESQNGIPIFEGVTLNGFGGDVENIIAQNNASIDLTTTILGQTAGTNIANEIISVAPNFADPDSTISIRTSDPIYIGQIDIDAGVPDLNIPLPSFLGGDVDGSDLISMTGDILYTSDVLVLSVDPFTILNSTVGNGSGTVVIDAEDETIKADVSLSLLDGLFTTNDSFSINSNFDIIMDGDIEFTIPKEIFGLSIPYIGGDEIGASYGFQYINDGDSSNDFVAVWHTFNVDLLLTTISKTVGIKVGFDGDVSLIGDPPALETGSWTLPAGESSLLLEARWDTPTENVGVTITAPDGTIYTEDQFPNNVSVVESLTGSTNKVVVITDPSAGVWDINVADSFLPQVGTVEYSASLEAKPENKPTLELLSPIVSDGGSSITIPYSAADQNSDAIIDLFIDDDNQDTDGRLIAHGLSEDSDSFVWDTEGVAPGDYYIYGRISDENNLPTFVYSKETITINENVDIAIEHIVDSDEAILGEAFTYELELQNSSNQGKDGIVIVNTLPENSTLVSTSIPISSQTDNVITFNNLAIQGGEIKTISVTVIPTELGTLRSNVSIDHSAYDGDNNNDKDFFSVNVNEEQADVIGTSQNDILQGTNQADIIRGGDGDDEINGGRKNNGFGEDQLFGEGGNDILKGGKGNDFLDGGDGKDQLFGGNHRDVLLGREGKDILRGQKGNDSITGGKGEDVLLGQKGDDILIGGKGNDRIAGGSGKDMMVYTSLQDGKDTIIEFKVGQDKIDLRQIFSNTAFVGENDLQRFTDLVQLVEVNGSTQIHVDADGYGGETNTVNLAIAKGVTGLIFENFVIS